MTTQVKGLDKWTRQVKRIPEAAKQALRDSQGKNAERIAGAIRAFAPFRKGALRASVGWTRGLPPSTSATGAFRIKARDLTERQSVLNSEGLFVSVYAGNNDAYYARWVEFGTKAGQRHRKSLRDRLSARRVTARPPAGRGHKGTNPQPFFYPAIRTYRARATRSTASAANRAIKKALLG